MVFKVASVGKPAKQEKKVAGKNYSLSLPKEQLRGGGREILKCGKKLDGREKKGVEKKKGKVLFPWVNERVLSPKREARLEGNYRRGSGSQIGGREVQTQKKSR